MRAGAAKLPSEACAAACRRRQLSALRLLTLALALARTRADAHAAQVKQQLRTSENTCGLRRREEDSLGDTSTLADPSVVQTLLSLRGK